MYQKVNDNLYIVTALGVGAVDTAITNLMNNMGDIPKSSYNVSINDNLYETILSRYITSDFITTNEEAFKKQKHIIVSIGINNKNYKITLGNLSSGEEPEYIHGILTD